MDRFSSLDRPSPVDLLRGVRRTRPADGDFAGADLRGADLRGLSLSFVSLAGAQMDEADLRGAQFRQVDLTGASLNGALLEGARFEFVQAGSASLRGAQARDMRWEQSRLVGADFTGADLASSVLRACMMETVCLDDADLRRAFLAYCNCEDARFLGARLEGADTVATQFHGAGFTKARGFFACREIVVEIVRREIGDDLEHAKLLGAVTLLPMWCYPDWKRLLADHPAQLRYALEIFARYPESGCLEALREGWRPAPTET